MGKADRLNQQLDRVEADYRNGLIAALRACAAGKWGLFGQHGPLGDSRFRVPALEDLMDLAESIDAIRDKLREAPFELHARFMAERGLKDGNRLGEPKLAAAWLDELAD